MNNKHFHRPHTTSKVVRGKRKTLEIELVAAGSVLVLGHILGAFWNWYEIYAFFDVIVHFTGGLWAALVLFAAFPFLSATSGTKKLFLAAAAFSFAIGGLWELFEFTIENYYHVNFQGPPLDTLSDLVVDTLGGLSAAFYIRRRG